MDTWATALYLRFMNLDIPMSPRSRPETKVPLSMHEPIQSMELLHSAGNLDPLADPPLDTSDGLGMLILSGSSPA
jgi:hypothetical protein